MIRNTSALVMILLGVAVSGACDSVQRQPATEALAQDKKEIWTCPMHPQIKKDGPGKCPICGMDLVKADTGGDEAAVEDSGQAHPHGHAEFRLSETRRQLIGVKTGVVEKKILYKTIDAAGRVAFDPELYAAQGEYLEALSQYRRVQESSIEEVKQSALRMVESAKLRLKVLGLSDEQIYSVSGRRSSDGSSLLIPRPGENVWIYSEVYEMDLPYVASGQDVKIRGEALGGEELIGKVVAVDRVINPQTRTVKVRITVPNAHARFRPEAFVETQILSPLGEQVSVPFDAVLDTGKEAWVFVTDGKGRFDPRLVTVKFRAGPDVAIASGVQPGEKIVTSANFLVDSESRLKAALADVKSQPQCPEGQVWHPDMKHCMEKVGEESQ